MKQGIIAALFLLFSVGIQAQIPEVLPRHFYDGEKEQQFEPSPIRLVGNTFEFPPPFEVRTSAEWEEIQSLVITWAGYSSILKQIAYWTKEECEVIIICEDENEVIDYLQSLNNGGEAFSDLDNITFVEEEFNSVWVRDYGQHTIYQEEVGQLHLVDWIYNRNRPDDDAVPSRIALEKDLNLYTTTMGPYDLMATGGNWMVDGLGTAFSSKLITDENSGGQAWWGAMYPDHTLEEIEEILDLYMGIDRYILMETLPYDGIHHIDMHMKLLDEETLIVGEYPDGVADGPQINANIEYVLSNYQSAFDEPYDVIRVEMPPEGGNYPDGNWPNVGDYRTYTNMVFVNKTVLVPIYEPEFDEPALEIIQNALPGYNVQGIVCNNIISASGAIHCITKAVGVDEPLWIVHQKLDDTDDDVNDYQVDAMMKHISGMDTGVMHYRVDGGDWVLVDMVESDPESSTWTAYIPAQPIGSIIDYYVEGNAVDGKHQVRPIVAPEGYWTFEVVDEIIVGIEEFHSDSNPISDIYPNPASEMTVIELNLDQGSQASIDILDVSGRLVQEIHKGVVQPGQSNYFLDARTLQSGVYIVRLVVGEQMFSRRLMVD